MALRNFHNLPRISGASKTSPLTILKSRKAMFFTLISIILITMFMIYFRMQESISLKTSGKVAESRITQMNDFVVSFEEIYAPRALYSISHRALGSITTYITWKNENKPDTDATKFFVENLTEAFRTAVNGSFVYDDDEMCDFQDGALDGKCPLSGMEGRNISYWFHKLSDVTKEEMGMDLDVNITNIYLEQDYLTGPWKVRAVMDVEYSLNTTGVAGWRRQRTRANGNPIMVEIDIIGFIDPYIAAMTNGTLNRTISINTNNTREIDSIIKFSSLVRNGKYAFENYSAPSFLSRFEGNTSPSYCCGIESFVYPSIAYNGEESEERDEYANSYLDFQFWRGRCYGEVIDEPEEGEEGEETDFIPALRQDASKTLWIPVDAYLTNHYLKMDSYHRFKVYPNIGTRFLTADEYTTEYGDEEGFIPISGQNCQAKYPIPEEGPS